jgi:TP901 family phage tail tape measure protein
MADLDTSILIKILDAFTAPLRKLESGLGNVEERANKLRKAFELSANLNQAAEAAGRFGQMIQGPLEGAVNEFRGFEKRMSEVAALSGEIGTEGFDKMREQALELGAATAFSSEEAAAAMAQYAQAGRTVNEILEITPMTLAAAKANGTGLAETAAIIGHTMSSMGISTAKTANVVDVLTAASAASDMKLTDLGTALAYVGPVARQAGMSLELTTAYLGKLKDAGLEASSAGTGMRAVLARLLDPSKEATKAFDKLGIHTKQLNELQKMAASGRMDEALARIGKAAEKLPNETRMKLMSQIFGIEASTAANVMISTTLDTSDKGVLALRDSLQKVDGTANRLAGVMTDNLDGALERASGAVSGLKTAVGEALSPSVASAAGTVEKLAGRMQAWTKENPKAAKATLELVGTLGLMSVGLKGALLAASTFVSATAGVQAALLKLSGSALGWVAAAGAAAAAGYAIGTWANETFGLSEKISAAMGRGAPDQADHQGLKSGDTQVFTGGWAVSGTSGEVVGMGRGKGPRIVQEARAAGANSMEEINAFIRQKRLTESMNASGGGTLLEQQARARDLAASPLADIGAAAPSPLLGKPAAASGGVEAAAAFTMATREQTDALTETLRKTERNTGLLVEALRQPQPLRLNPGAGF